MISLSSLPLVRSLTGRLRHRARSARELAKSVSWPLFVKDLPLDALRARYELPGSRYVDIDGVRVHLVEEGEGPPLLLFHGLSASLHTWNGWARELRRSFRVIRVDLPGFGLTGPDPRARYSLEQSVSFVESLRQELGLERFFLAGNSLGGLVSWYYASVHPERVQKLIVLDPVAYPLEPVPLPFIEFFATPAGRRLAPRLDPRTTIARGVVDVYGDRERVAPEVVRRYQELALHPGNRLALTYYCRELMRLNRDRSRLEQIKQLKVPTLLVWGDQDRWIPVSQVELWKRDVPELQVKIYSGVGHVPMEEIPEESAKDARAFFLG